MLRSKEMGESGGKIKEQMKKKDKQENRGRPSAVYLLCILLFSCSVV